jgi:hypothetical protein
MHHLPHFCGSNCLSGLLRSSVVLRLLFVVDEVVDVLLRDSASVATALDLVDVDSVFLCQSSDRGRRKRLRMMVLLLDSVSFLF